MSLIGKWFGFGRDSLYDAALRAYERGAYEEAAQKLHACLEETTEPAIVRLARWHLADALAQLGHQAHRAGDPRTASERFRDALEVAPGYADLHAALARAARDLGDRDAQRAALDAALRINPRFLEAILQQAVLWYEDGRTDEALDRIAQAVAIDPALDGPTYAQALAAHRAGHPREAVKHFLHLHSSAALDANARARVADDYVRQGLFEEAADEYRRALAIAPRYADLRCKLGQVLAELEDLEGAVAEFEAALQINPRYVEAHAQLGIALKRMGKNREAQAAFRKASDLDPAHPVAALETGRLTRA